MLMMRCILRFQVVLGAFLGAVYRFIATILWGEDEAFRRAQAATVEFAEQNAESLAGAMRVLQSPVQVTMPDRYPPGVMVLPQSIDAEFVEERGVLFAAGPYRILREHPPNENCPYWLFDFTGPGFEEGDWTFIGATQKCGASNMDGLATAFKAGYASALTHQGVPCRTR